MAEHVSCNKQKQNHCRFTEIYLQMKNSLKLNLSVQINKLSNYQTTDCICQWKQNNTAFWHNKEYYLDISATVFLSEMCGTSNMLQLIL